MKIYLAGSVPKGDNELKNFYDWRADYLKVIQKTINNVEILDPNVFSKLEGNPHQVVGADCFYLKESDLIIVNAEDKIGAGTAMELVIAKYFKKPVIVILPKNSYHRKLDLQFDGRVVKDWIHPFIYTFSDCLIEKISDFEYGYKNIDLLKIKDINIVNKSIKEFVDLNIL